MGHFGVFNLHMVLYSVKGQMTTLFFWVFLVRRKCGYMYIFFTPKRLIILFNYINVMQNLTLSLSNKSYNKLSLSFCLSKLWIFQKKAFGFIFNPILQGVLLWLIVLLLTPPNFLIGFTPYSLHQLIRWGGGVAEERPESRGRGVGGRGSLAGQSH